MGQLWRLAPLLFLVLLFLACGTGGSLRPAQEQPSAPASLPTLAAPAGATQPPEEAAAAPAEPFVLMCGDVPCKEAAAQPDCLEDCGPVPFIHRDGILLRDGAGDQVTLRGVNLGGWLHWEGWIWGGGLNSETRILDQLQEALAPDEVEAFRRQVYDTFITEEDFARIAELGFNVVRIPINHRLLETDEEPYVYRPEGWEVLDRAMDWAETYGVYVVLTLHSAPGGQSRLFTSDPGETLVWESEELQTRTAALWQALAERYREREIIAGYDLLNEPDPPDGEALVELYKYLIAAIRAVDPSHLVILEGADYGKDFSMFEGPLSYNQAYSFHMYTWFGDNREELLADYAAVAEAHDVPMWNGEFGENEYEMLQSTRRLLEDPQYHLAGWAFWTWKKVPNRYPYLLGLTVSEPWQAVVDCVEWCHWPREALTTEEVKAGTDAFLATLRQGTASEDERMIELLTAEEED